MTDSSPLAHIKGKLAETRKTKTLDLLVPGLADEGVHVRYARTVGYDQFVGYTERRKAQKRSGWQLLASLDFLADSCEGVFAVVDGVKYGFAMDAPTDPEEWPRFDQRVREMLPDGVEAEAVEICRALFAVGYNEEERGAADAAIMEHADELVTFCGWAKGK